MTSVNARLVVGTAGHSIWISDDLGKTWTYPYAESGLYPECRVWAIQPDRSDPDRLLLGTDIGVHAWYISGRRAEHWPSPLDHHPIWSLVQSPHDPRVVIAGTQEPAALFRSEDGGRNWERLDTDFPRQCMFIGRPRVTQILFDPIDPNLIWVGVEIGGVYRSEDAGRSWTKVVAGLVSEDMHWLTLVTEPQHTLFATTNRGIHRSLDRGDSWQVIPFDSPWPYTRAMVPRADGNGTMFLCNGNGPPGSMGKLQRSRDFGVHWEEVAIRPSFNSTPWCFAVNPADPRLMFLCTNLGQVFRTDDGGESWIKLDRELGEIRTAVWLPA